VTMNLPIVNDVRSAVRTFRNRLLPRTDFRRWQDLSNYNHDWDERTKTIAGLIAPGSRVLEFGAGRRQLEALLPPGCRYIPSDLVSRGEGTIVCDLNSPPFPDLRELQIDTAVFGGVLEYVTDLPRLVSWLSGQVRTCIASYECARSAPRTFARLRESFERARIGWLNSYDEAELRRIFAPFEVSEKVRFSEPHGDGQIFVFRLARRRSAAD
jgi:hypothetical protein